METFNFQSLVTNGKLADGISKQIMDALKLLEGKMVTIEIKEKVKIRTLKQNRFYQGPFIQAFQKFILDCGQRVSQDDIHSGLRDAHAKNSYTIMLPGDIPFKIPPSTTRLSTVSFEDFLTEIRADYAGRFGWQLPFPHEEVE